MQTAGYNATLVLTAVGTTATASVSLASGISYINLLNGGVNYSADPTVKISPPLASGGIAAEAVAITTSIGFTDSRRVKDIFITNPGTGYTMTPSIQFLTEDGKGSGADAVVGISSGSGVGQVSLDNTGSKYMVPPSVTFTAAPSGGTTATAVSILNDNGSVQAIRLTNAGTGYTVAPTIQVAAAGTIGVGTFSYGEIITGQSSLSTAFVTSWDAPSLTLTARNLAGDFNVGEIIVDNEGSAYRLHSINYDDDDSYNSGDEIEVAEISVVDFSERNPFGEV